MTELVEPRVRGLVAEHLGVDSDELSSDVSLVDELAVDSLDIVELALFVDIDQHIPFHGISKPRALDLARLKHRVAVREDHGRSPAAETLQHVERDRVEAIRERVVHHER